jgi:dihydroflavonol-4-reductase/farnesol dehydrogenase
MKVFVTGGTGFIGGRVVQRLRARGDEVVALVRSPDKAAQLEALGCEWVEGDLSSTVAIRRGVDRCDAVIHAGAIYKVGIPASERPEMIDTNVHGTERVLDAAIEAGTGRIVYVSTVGVFGNTNERIVDETYTRDTDDFLSCYDETKFRAHEMALDRIAHGAPIVIVQPAGVYGPGDHSEIANIIDQVRTGKLKMMVFPELGLDLVHVDDVADGILAALDRGRVGESYVLGGEITRMRNLVELVAEMTGRKAPKRALPVGLMKISAPAGPLVGKALGFPPNLRELIRTSDGVTLWASDEKARRELGYDPRELRAGLEDTLASPAT